MNIHLRHFFALCAVVLCSAVIPPVRGQDVLNGIAAVVNSDVITFSQVRELVAAKEKVAHDQFPPGEVLNEKIKEIRLQAVNDLIDRQLILQEFKTMETKGAKIPEHVLEEDIDRIVREEFGGDRSAFIRTLAADGLTLDKFREMEMDKIIVQAMRSQLVKPSVVVPEPKIAEYYKANLEQYTSEEQIKLRLLLIKKFKATDPDIDRRKTIEEIRQKIAAGASFEDLARVYSEDGSTQDSGGDMGWINRRVLSESLSKAAFNLKPGELSRIIEVGGMYYLLYCEAHKGQVTKTLTDVREEIEKNLIQVERQKAQQDWIAKLRRKAFIKIF